MSEYAEMTRARARAIEHEWDARALDWPLTAESVVVEVGGYTGRWALQIAERYAPRLFVFEPQPWAVEACHAVLGNRALVWGCALGTHDGDVIMGRWGTDGCSLLIEGGEPAVRMREIGGLFADLDIAHIDLMLMNIEGYEYTLIPHMIKQNILPQRLMVQFHEFADPSGDGMARIGAALAMLGYRMAWTYGAVLTAWERS